MLPSRVALAIGKLFVFGGRDVQDESVHPIETPEMYGKFSILL